MSIDDIMWNNDVEHTEERRSITRTISIVYGTAGSVDPRDKETQSIFSLTERKIN